VLGQEVERIYEFDLLPLQNPTGLQNQRLKILSHDEGRRFRWLLASKREGRDIQEEVRRRNGQVAAKLAVDAELPATVDLRAVEVGR